MYSSSSSSAIYQCQYAASRPNQQHCLVTQRGMTCYWCLVSSSRGVVGLECTWLTEVQSRTSSSKHHDKKKDSKHKKK